MEEKIDFSGQNDPKNVRVYRNTYCEGTSLYQTASFVPLYMKLSVTGGFAQWTFPSNVGRFAPWSIRSINDSPLGRIAPNKMRLHSRRFASRRFRVLYVEHKLNYDQLTIRLRESDVVCSNFRCRKLGSDFSVWVI